MWWRFNALWYWSNYWYAFKCTVTARDTTLCCPAVTFATALAPRVGFGMCVSERLMVPGTLRSSSHISVPTETSHSAEVVEHPKKNTSSPVFGVVTKKKKKKT